MKRYRPIVQRLLYPNIWIVVLLALTSVMGLVCVFGKGLEQRWMAYMLYPLSAYALVILSLRVCLLGRILKERLYKNAFYHRYKSDLDFKAYISCHVSMGITLFFCIAKAAAAIYYHSIWWGAVTFYYIVLGAMRFLLVRQLRGRRINRRKVYKQYRFCGYLLLLLTLSLGGICLLVICHGETMSYPGFIIYGAAGFAFYNLIKAACNLVWYARRNNPVHSASKILSFAAALVSLFFLQTAMFSSFGDGALWQQIMNAGTGTCVFLLIAGMAVAMIRTGTRTFNRIQT